jgi:hypothetical protein
MDLEPIVLAVGTTDLWKLVPATGFEPAMEFYLACLQGKSFQPLRQTGITMKIGPDGRI